MLQLFAQQVQTAVQRPMLLAGRLEETHKRLHHERVDRCERRAGKISIGEG